MALFRRKRARISPDDQATVVGDVTVQPRLVGTDLPEGTEVAGYRVQSVLGRGGMGVVYRAEHVHLVRPVALKVLAPGLSGDFRERFVRESQVAASLSHPNVIAVYDAGDYEGMLYIAMQLITGTDLGAQLREDGAREPADVVRTTEQVASALDAAHGAGLVHRDVKPANILVAGEHHWLGDFGLSKRLASNTALTHKSDIVGTPDYLAPEQIEGGPVEGRADQYALACVVHHCLTGEPPFARDSNIAIIRAHIAEQAPRLSELRPGIAQEVDDVLARAMAKDPADRFPRAADFARSLRSAFGLSDAGGEAAAGAHVDRIAVGVRDAGTRAVIRAALGRGSVEIAEADDAGELLALARESRPSLVLVDATLPGAPTSALCRELRATAGTEQLPIIALAERGQDDQWRAALAAGTDDVLLRPFSAFQLLAKVRDHLPQALER